jgi:hypothetical protein
MSLFLSCIEPHLVKFGKPAVADFAAEQSRRNHASDASSMGECSVGEHAHESDTASDRRPRDAPLRGNAASR